MRRRQRRGFEADGTKPSMAPPKTVTTQGQSGLNHNTLVESATSSTDGAARTPELPSIRWCSPQSRTRDRHSSDPFQPVPTSLRIEAASFGILIEAPAPGERMP